MIDNLPDPGTIDEKKILAKMARMTRMARTVARMAHRLADFADPMPFSSLDQTQGEFNSEY